MDIVNRAAMNCGVASSFNPDEVPEDMQARGADILRHEIIPMMNCDRTLDITEIVYPAKPVNGIVSLTTTPTNYREFIFGQVEYSYNQLREKRLFTTQGVSQYYYPNIRTLLINHGYINPNRPDIVDKTDKWPCDQFGNYRKMFVWSSDFKLVDISTTLTGHGELDDELLDTRYNIPFTPMRVESVVRECDGAVLQYLHAEEMVSAEFRHAQLVYGVEDLPDRMVIRLNKEYADQPLLLVIPIPLKIVNTYDEPQPWTGTIIAPEKFRSYLIAKLAYRLAVEYGLNTATIMAELVKESYQALIKNISKREHAQDIPRKIHNYLRRVEYNGSIYGGIEGGRI